MKTWKRVMAIVLAIMLVVSGVYLGHTEGTKALAASTAGVTENGDYVAIAYEEVNTGAEIPTAKSEAYADWLFAGWFTGEGCTIESALSSADTPDANCYAKFVPKEILDVKVQIATTKETTQYGEVYVMRFISSVDSLDYNQVGFEVVDAAGTKKTCADNTVYEAIDSELESVSYQFGAQVLDTESKYFITAKMAVESESADYTVRAYWKTLDGKTVYGESRCVSVNDGKADTPISLSFKNVSGEAIAKGDSLAVTYGDSKTATASVVDVNGTTVYVRITLDDDTKDSLPSVTKFVFGTAGNSVYRNLYTKYTGTESADRTWYDIYEAEGDTEFVIATAADLYGFAAVVNAESDADSFAGKKVYLAADINANAVDAVDWATGEVKDGKTAYPWNPIGTLVSDTSAQNRSFRGTFNGNGHTIAGIYLDGEACNTSCVGLFGYALNAVIKNFQLSNSYYTGKKVIGSILGDGDGTLAHIKCNDSVYINGSASETGGLVGRFRDCSVEVSTTSGNENTYGYVTDCWFDGNIDVSYVADDSHLVLGGILGYKTHGVAKFDNVLFTGTINGTLISTATNRKTMIGGIMGNQVFGSYEISNSVCAGELSGQTFASATSENDSTRVNVGLVYGLSGTCTYSNVYAVKTENCTQAVGSTTTTPSGVTLQDATTLDGKSGADLGFEEAFYWETRTEDVPALKIFANADAIADDYEWLYENAGTEDDPYLISNIKEFIVFETMVNDEKYVFADRTVALNNSVTANKGTIHPDKYSDSEWSAFVETLTEWTPIGSKGTKQHSFAGVFDGKDYSVSGLYFDIDANYAGLFGFTQDCSVKNLRLLNSYFKQADGYEYLGSVSGGGDGTFENIYSDVYLTNTYDGIGGIIGRVSDYTSSTSTTKTLISKCWYDGEIHQVYDDKMLTGGLIGFVVHGAITSDGIYQNIVRDSLFTGVINCTYTGSSSSTAMRVGGICGMNNAGTVSELLIETSVSAGAINIENTTGVNVGSFIGLANGSSIATASSGVTMLSDVYATAAYGLNAAGDNRTFSSAYAIDFSDTTELETAVSVLNGEEFPVWLLNENAEDAKYKLILSGFDDVLDLNCEKEMLAFYDDTMSYDNGQGGLAIYMPTERGYVNYNFVHSYSESRNSDMWRLSIANLVDDSGNIVKQITQDGAEWEMAIWLDSRTDFIGGYAHGDEKYTQLTMSLDEVQHDITSLTQYTSFDEIKLTVDSEGFDPADNTTKVLEHRKEYVVNEGGVTLNQTVTWLGDYKLRNNSYLAMMPPLKHGVTDVTDIITDSYYTDMNAEQILIGESLPITQEDISSVCVFGSKSGIYFTMSKSNCSPTTYTNANVMSIDDNSGLNYNKMYFTFAGPDDITEGTVWTSTTGYQIDWR